MRELRDLPGVGPYTLKKLHHLKIESIQDLLQYYPRKYEDFSNLEKIANVKPGEVVTVRGSLTGLTSRYVRRGLHISRAAVSDDSGSVEAVWFNRPYLKDQFKPNKTYYFSGELRFSHQRYQLNNPDYEAVDSDNLNTARIVSIYRETKGLTSKRLRKLIAAALPYVEQIEIDVPEKYASYNQFISFYDAIRHIHQPPTQSDLQKAKNRLAFGELFTLALSGLLARRDIEENRADVIRFHESQTKAFVAQLPFTLTNDQRRAAWTILQDMSQGKPMNRLLDGDVGSGKTVVAAIASLNVIRNNLQVCLVAPTTILAKQHYKTLKGMLGKEAVVELLLSDTRASEKNKIKADLKRGDIDVIVGTHALLQPDISFQRLGLLVIDEQHRFGVEQRRRLMQHDSRMPHVLTMSATPIPRSLALTLYGELDISQLIEKPPGRQHTKTVLYTSAERSYALQTIKKEIRGGHQAFVVCPIIRESSTLPSLSAEEAFALYQEQLPGLRLALLHGKIKSDDKQSIMQSFIDGKIDVLIATSLVEVGVDVENATVMVIESAERFGLAQLHQLRGRVGRSRWQSYCLLITSGAQKPAARLQVVERTNDGFKLAEMDLRLRGPGAIYGTLQHGALDLRIANFGDRKLLQLARNSAVKFISSGQDLLNYKQLAKNVNTYRAITSLN